MTFEQKQHPERSKPVDKKGLFDTNTTNWDIPAPEIKAFGESYLKRIISNASTRFEQ
jgi:hypothetical protein